MLKTRVMPTLLHKDLGLVKGVRFNSWRRVGALLPAIKVYAMRQVDELVFLDITASAQQRGPDFALVDDFADECFVPLTVGGGVRTVEDVRGLLKVGADKVAICTAAVETPHLIRQAAENFGSQCVVVAIDVKLGPGGGYGVMIHSGQTSTGLDPVNFAQSVAQLGAGEILLTSVDHDGTLQGYDLELIRRVAGAVSVPVIASGGAGTYEHMAEAILHGGASAVAAASMFHFTEQTPLEAKRFLYRRAVQVRL